jgi:hypothetical protein
MMEEIQSDFFLVFSSKFIRVFTFIIPKIRIDFPSPVTKKNLHREHHLSVYLSIYLSMFVYVSIYGSTAFLWTLAAFRILDLLRSRYNSLDGGSDWSKAAPCTQDNTRTE